MSLPQKASTMSRSAWAYVVGVLCVGLLLDVLLLFHFRWSAEYQSAFLCLLIASVIAQLCKVEAPNHVVYYATPMFYFAGVLLLPPTLYIVVVIVSLLVEWIKERMIGSRLLRDWYLQPFNMAMYTITGFTAGWVYHAVVQDQPLYSTAAFITAGLAAYVYFIMNQILLSLALAFARGVPLERSGLLTAHNLMSEFVLLFQGYIVTIFWIVNPLLILTALLPLVVFYRALMVPQLQKEAQTDSKTGLMNTRYFNKRFEEELDRAQRFHRPLAFIMADLDLLRDINNTYGHLAGDKVLIGVGNIIHQSIREYDLAARFGGEEFALVCPEVGPEEARVLAERMRMSVAAALFQVATHPAPIRATMSFGIACFPQDATNAEDLYHVADVAVYQAKLQGRNRVVAASDVPGVIEPQHQSAESPNTASYAAAYALAKRQPVADAPASDSLAYTRGASDVSEHSS